MTELATINEGQMPVRYAHSMEEMWRMAQAFAKSGLFGFNTPEQALSLLLIAQADGTHPAQAVREYHIIKGRPSLSAEAMLARHQKSGGSVEWLEYNADTVSGKFGYRGAEVTITFDTARAKELGVQGKDTWRQHPAAMRRSRCITEGVRTVNPGAILGFYTPDEVEQFSSVDIIAESKAAGDYQTQPMRETPLGKALAKVSQVHEADPDADRRIDDIATEYVDATFTEVPEPVTGNESFGLDQASRAVNGDQRERIHVKTMYSTKADGSPLVTAKGQPFRAFQIVRADGSSLRATYWNCDWPDDVLQSGREYLAIVEQAKNKDGSLKFSRNGDPDMELHQMSAVDE